MWMTKISSHVEIWFLKVFEDSFYMKISGTNAIKLFNVYDENYELQFHQVDLWHKATNLKMHAKKIILFSFQTET